MKIYKLFIVMQAILLASLFNACSKDEKESEPDNPPATIYPVNVTLSIDWASVVEQKPNRITVCLYNQNDSLMSGFVASDVNNTTFTLPVGHYRVIVFNGDINSFQDIAFENIENFEAFKCKSRSYAHCQDSVYHPYDSLFVAVDSFDIEAATAAETTFQKKISPQLLQTMLHIRLHINNLWGLGSVIGFSISGMADGCSMAHTWRNDSECTYYVETPQYNVADEWLEMDIPVWGFPNGKERAEWRNPENNILKIILANNFSGGWRTNELNVGQLLTYHEPQAMINKISLEDLRRHIYLEISEEIDYLLW